MSIVENEDTGSNAGEPAAAMAAEYGRQPDYAEWQSISVAEAEAVIERAKAEIVSAIFRAYPDMPVGALADHVRTWLDDIRSPVGISQEPAAQAVNPQPLKIEVVITDRATDETVFRCVVGSVGPDCSNQEFLEQVHEELEHWILFSQRDPGFMENPMPQHAGHS